MDVRGKDPNLGLEYEEMEKRLKALEDENRSLQLRTKRTEQGLDESGRLLLSSLRIFNLNAEIKKLVGCLLEISKNLEKTLAKSSIQFDHMRILENEVNSLQEKLTEVKNPGFPFNMLDSLKEYKQKVAEKESFLSGCKAVCKNIVGKTTSAKVENLGNCIIGVTITHLWNAMSFCQNNPDALFSIQGAALAFLLLKFMSEEKEKQLIQELPGSSKMVLNGLSCHIRDLEPLTTTADKLDQVLYKGLGMSLYSTEFLDLCLSSGIGSTYATSLENLDNFISTLSIDIRKNIDRIMSDKELEKPLRQLKEVVWNETFLRASALYQACKLLETLPNCYLSKYDDFILDAVQFACQQILPASGPEMKRRSLREIANGIVRMRNDYKRISDLYSFTD